MSRMHAQSPGYRWDYGILAPFLETASPQDYCCFSSFDATCNQAKIVTCHRGPDPSQ